MQFEQIKNKFDILDVAEHFVGSELYECGIETFEFDEGECPFCGHKDCFRINKQESPGYFNCFSCGEGGDSIRLVEKLGKVSARQAADLIIEALGAEVDIETIISDDVPEVSDAILDSDVDEQLRGDLFYWAAVHYNGNLFTAMKGMEYQQKVRGHNYDSLDKFDVGFADGKLKECLLNRGFKEKDLSKYSLLNKRGADFFPGNVFIYPHINEDFDVCSFSFKDPAKEKQWQLPNSAKDQSVRFFGQQTLARFPDEIILIEGENDLLSLCDIGWNKGLLATTGQISKRQMEYLKIINERYDAKGLAAPRIITLFDTDDAGDLYRKKVSDLKLENIIQVKFDGAKDIDELIQKGEVNSVQSLRNLINENQWMPVLDFEAAGFDDYEVTEMDHGLRLLHLLGGRGRYITDKKEWIFWQGACWREDAILNIKHQIKEVARYWNNKAAEYREQVNKEGDDTKRDILLGKLKHCKQQANKLLSKAGMDNIVSMAITDPRFHLLSSDLNKNPQLLGLQNGIYDLDLMRLKSSVPELLVTKQLPFSFDRYATCPTWEKFIDETVRANSWPEVGKELTQTEAEIDAQQMKDFLQEVAGITLSGKPNVKGFLYFIGKKDTGKSVFTNLLLELMGQYGKSVTPQSLMNGSMQGGDVKAPEIVGLDGVRLALASEAPEGARLNEDLIKRLTGADPVTARGNYSNPVTFMPQLTLMFSANERPALTSASQAFWERLMVVPFLNRVPAERQDRELAQKLRQELPGIFLWCLEGWRRFNERGKLEMPERVKAYSKSLKEVQDVLGEFLDDTVEREQGAYIACDAFYLLYKKYMENAGMSPLGRPRFVSKLEDLGISRIRKRFGSDSNPRYYYQGLTFSKTSGFDDDLYIRTFRH